MDALTIASSLGGARPNGKGWLCRCPSHDDKTPSLSITTALNGRTLLHCHAGCAQKAVISALKERNLWPVNGSRTEIPSHALPPERKPAQGKAKAPITQPGEPEARKAANRLSRQWTGKGYCPTGFFTYTDAQGQPMFWRIRLDHPEREKIVRPLWFDGKEWQLKEPPAKGNGKPLYGLAGLANNPEAVCWIVEGEPKVDALARLGLVAVTSGGASSASAADWNPLSRRRVIIWPDHDEPGQKYANDVAEKLRNVGAKLEGIIDTDKLGIPEHGDVVDWLMAHPGTPAEQIEALPRIIPSAPDSKLPKIQAKTICMSDVKPERIEWLWPGKVAIGKLTLLVGDPGNGKSHVTVDMAARVSTGRPWPDGTPCPRGNVILITAEDDIGDTLRPRLDGAEADVSRVHALECVVRQDQKTGEKMETSFNLQDMAALKDVVEKHDPRLIIIDPVSAYLGGVDSHKNTDVRGILAPLSELAARRRVAILAVSHMNKSSGPATYRVMGSLAFVAAARAALAITKDPDEPERRLLLPVKNNIAEDQSGLAFRVVPAENHSSRVAWEPDPVNVDISEALTPEGYNGEKTTRREAETWLLDILKGGPEPAKEIKRQANDAGFSWSTIERAKAAIGIKAEREGFSGGRWVWKLPEDRHESPKTAKTVTHGKLTAFGEIDGLRRNEAPQETDVQGAEGMVITEAWV